MPAQHISLSLTLQIYVIKIASFVPQFIIEPCRDRSSCEGEEVQRLRYMKNFKQVHVVSFTHSGDLISRRCRSSSHCIVVKNFTRKTLQRFGVALISRCILQIGNHHKSSYSMILFKSSLSLIAHASRSDFRSSTTVLCSLLITAILKCSKATNSQAKLQYPPPDLKKNRFFVYHFKTKQRAER